LAFPARIICIHARRRPGLSANEPAIIRAGLQSSGIGQDYLQLKSALDVVNRAPNFSCAMTAFWEG
jgi:hypothetical protein